MVTIAFAVGCSADAAPKKATPSASVSASTGAPSGLKLPEAKADPREVLLAQSISALLSEKHLLKRSLDDTVSKRAFAELLETLDGGKLFLLE